MHHHQQFPTKTYNSALLFALLAFCPACAATKPKDDLQTAITKTTVSHAVHAWRTTPHVRSSEVLDVAPIAGRAGYWCVVTREQRIDRPGAGDTLRLALKVDRRSGATIDSAAFTRIWQEGNPLDLALTAVTVERTSLASCPVVDSTSQAAAAKAGRAPARSQLQPR